MHRVLSNCNLCCIGIAIAIGSFFLVPLGLAIAADGAIQAIGKGKFQPALITLFLLADILIVLQIILAILVRRLIEFAKKCEDCGLCCIAIGATIGSYFLLPLSFGLVIRSVFLNIILKGRIDPNILTGVFVLIIISVVIFLCLIKLLFEFAKDCRCNKIAADQSV